MKKFCNMLQECDKLKEATIKLPTRHYPELWNLGRRYITVSGSDTNDDLFDRHMRGVRLLLKN